MRRLICLALVFFFLQGSIDLIAEEEGEVKVVTVDSTNLRFNPSTITLNEGDSVRFVWGNQALPHNAVEENEVFDSGEPARNLEYEYFFDYESAGVYDYVCEPHASVGMQGEITVQDVEQAVVEDPEVKASTSDGLPIISILVGTALVFAIGTSWYFAIKRRNLI
tara:strand:- start:2144 stop:2638 length:495 start_codon:yes stop_codon:yes gene_type:complete